MFIIACKHGHGTTDWFQIGKGVRQGCILSLCLSNMDTEYIIRNTGLEEAQAGSISCIFRKCRGTKDQIDNIGWIIEKTKRIPEKHLLLLY